MFGSDMMPLGPDGQFPPQRVSTSGNQISPPPSVEEIYDMNQTAQLPVTEKDFQSSIDAVQNRCKRGGRVIREGKMTDDAQPRYAPMDNLGGLGGSRDFLQRVKALMHRVR